MPSEVKEDARAKLKSPFAILFSIAISLTATNAAVSSILTGHVLLHGRFTINYYEATSPFWYYLWTAFCCIGGLGFGACAAMGVWLRFADRR
jgi:hypothetical protein